MAALQQEEAEFKKSIAVYRKLGYDEPPTEWERLFWEAGYKHGINAALRASDQPNRGA